MSAPRPKVAIVAPCYNEEDVLPAFIARVQAVAAELPRFDFEFLLVDDGSRDTTCDVIRQLAEADPRIRGVFLSRNFGQQRAITAGLDFCDADYIIVMDSDLQDLPELIHEILPQLEAGYNLVHTVRADRSVDSFLKREAAQFFYALMRRFVLPELPYNAGDYKGFDREVLHAFRQYRERVRFLRGIFATLGFRQTTVTFRRDSRHSGRSQYPLKAILRLGRDAVLSNTTWPLRLGAVAGAPMLLASPFAFIAALLATGHRHANLNTALLLFIGGAILTLLAAIGEYLRILVLETKHRPLYIVRELHNLPVQPGPPRPGQN